MPTFHVRGTIEVPFECEKSDEGRKSSNRFTKVSMALDADEVLRRYFTENRTKVEGWFNIIAPKNVSLGMLRDELKALGAKDWKRIHGT